MKVKLSNSNVVDYARTCAMKLSAQSGISSAKVWGIPKSGIPAAYAVASAFSDLGVPTTLVDSAQDANVIVDDVIDSGTTMNQHMKEHYDHARFACLVDKSEGRLHHPSYPYVWGTTVRKTEWTTFPWDVDSQGHDTGAHDAVVRMLQFIGEDPSRGGLQETPKRVVKAWSDWFAGYHIDPKSLFKSFTDGAEGVNEMVLLTEIPVFSHCEHHIAPFTGVAHVAYIPNGKIVGLSKLARVVDAFSRRLQVQERLTNQIVDCIMAELDPLGAAVVIKAKHSCMSTRGVKVHNVDTTTSALRGVFLTDPSVRGEFMYLAK